MSAGRGAFPMDEAAANGAKSKKARLAGALRSGREKKLTIESDETTRKLSVLDHRTDFRGLVDWQGKTEDESRNGHRNDQQERNAELTTGGIPIETTRKALIQLIVIFVNERHNLFPPKHPALAGVAIGVHFPVNGH